MNRIVHTPHITAILLVLLLLTSACGTAPETTPTPTPCPTPAVIPSSTPVRPTRTAPTPPPSPTPDYQKEFRESLPASSESCHPDGTADDIGIYIYDLTEGRELVSINADVPFQYASAFKAPVLLYFLSSCRQYWDVSSSEWEAYYRDAEAAKNVSLFISLEYERIITEFIAQPANWKRTDAFFIDHRQMVDGKNGEVDTRYFILQKVYAMIAQSGNHATADVLNFIQQNCTLPVETDPLEACGGQNAIISFNTWFDDFTGLTYISGEPRRGLYSWDTVIQNGTDGSQETILSTYGLKDTCANQTAVLKCDPAYTGFNTYTARDLFQFYNTLYHLQDETLRDTALGLLVLDEPGPARGYLKNMARSLQAYSFSKNGHAFFTNGSINADAGILLYKGKAYIIVTLSFNALGTMTGLYGSYDEDGYPVGESGLIQALLESNTYSPWTQVTP